MHPPFISRPLRLTALLLGALLINGCAPGTIGQGTPLHDVQHGEMLYSTYCVSCHTTQVHWREKKVAVDWASLQAEVRRWQGAARLQWTDTDIADVSQYLSDLHYRFVEPD